MHELNQEFVEKIAALCRRKRRYRMGAYAFMQDAVLFTIDLNTREKGSDQGRRHISGQELLDKIRQLLLLKYGPMARQVLDYWGVAKTEDFGEIVFDMVALELLSVNPEDNIDDFAHGYDFEDAFVKPFQVSGRVPELPKLD